MKQLRIKLIVWLVIATCGVVAAVVTIFIANQRILTTTGAIQGVLSQAAASDSAIKSLIKAQSHTADLSDQLTTLQGAFIENDNPLPYLTKLEELATTTNVTVKLALAEGNATTTLPTGIRVMPMIVTINGPWENDLKFINAMMQQPTYFSTTDFDINGTATDNAGSITVTLHGNMYWQ